MSKSAKTWGLVIIILMFSGLACGLSAKTTPLPAPPEGHIEPKPEAVERTEQNFNQAMQEASGNRQFRFRLTNEQATSLAAMGLQKRADIPFSEPQIWFTAGKIYITGKVEGVGPAALPALIVAIPAVNANGQLEITVEEAKMASFDFPQDAIDSLAQTINETLIDLQLKIQVTAIDVREGELLIAGKRTSQ